jgi:DNA polymerase-3 subunit delta'
LPTRRAAVEPAGLGTPDDHPIVKLISAGSHPGHALARAASKEKGEGLARNITVKQVRELSELFDLSPAMSKWRVAVIDTIDELEPSAPTRLLKMLEEPPPNSIFLLVSHAPGRLLPTIRSRCRRLDFQRSAMTP